MSNPFADLVARLDRLPEHLGEIVDGIRLAIKIAAIDPEMSLTKARKVLEHIVYEVFRESVGEPPGTRPLQELTQRLVKEKHLPNRVAAYVNIVRELGNAGTHATGEHLSREDVAQSISQLLIVVDWFDARSNGARGGPIAESAEEVPDRPRWLSDPTASRKVGAEALLGTLEPILADVALPVDQLRRLYGECAPPAWEPHPPSHEPLTMLRRCVSGLARAPRQDGDELFPLLKFVRGLRDQVDAETSRALDGWLDASLVELCFDSGEVTRLRETLERSVRPEASSGPDCYLLVQVTPRLYEAARYGVKAWIYGTGDPACLLAGDEAMTLEQVQACLDDLGLKLYQSAADPKRARVELLLPRELLCVDVDQWMAENAFIEASPLGVEHRLVVRSLERASRPKAAMALLARGEALGKTMEARCRLVDGLDGEALWIAEDQAGGVGLYTSLRDAHGVVGVALGAAPHPNPKNPKVDVLNTLFEAGLPVVVWSRKPAGLESASTREALLDLLGHEPFGRLPDRVWELRKQATRSEDSGHIGRHLSLLWDDPTRTSPDFETGHRLRAPSRD